MEIGILTLDDSIPLWKRIQMLFPEEPDWECIDEEVLAKLVEEFESEPSCATAAILYLQSKNPERCKVLAQWLIGQPEADQWLKAAATDAIAGLQK
jgi:hypothetical protein